MTAFVLATAALLFAIYVRIVIRRQPEKDHATLCIASMILTLVALIVSIDALVKP
jgi:hypothetical protein